jgi:DNA-binding MarR family transcriptional regulator
LADAHGVTPQNINAIVVYRSWWPDPSVPSAPRSVRSLRAPNGYLTWAQVLVIRARFRQGTARVRELATEHHVSPETIRRVVSFRGYWPEPGAEATPRPAALPWPRPRSPRPRGEQTRSARLTWAQVRRIRARYAASGISLGQLAREHGVNVSTVSRIVHRQLWWPDPGDAGVR